MRFGNQVFKDYNSKFKDFSVLSTKCCFQEQYKSWMHVLLFGFDSHHQWATCPICFKEMTQLFSIICLPLSVAMPHFAQQIISTALHTENANSGVPSKPVQASFDGGVEIAFVSIHDQQYGRVVTRPAAVAVVDDGAPQRHDAIMFGNISTSKT